MMEQSSITTRARAQKLNNFNQDIIESREKNKQLLKGRKSSEAKDDMEITVKQSARKNILDAKATVGKSKKKSMSNRKHNVIREIESEDKSAVCKDESINCGELIKMSKDKYVDNIPTVELANDNLSQYINSEDSSKSLKKMQQKTIEPNTKELSGMVTPKSTPIKLSLTPHRSTKTPKKSPISLSSPKTHSISVSRLLKTPRKLSLTPEVNLYKYNDSGDTKLQKVKKNGLRSVSASNESSPVSSVVKNKRRASNVKLKEIVHKFSKSPKIILRSPSKRTKSPKFNVPTSRKSQLKESIPGDAVPGASPSCSSTKLRVSARKTPLPEHMKNSLTNKRQLLSSRLVKLLTASQMRDVLAEPIVLLKKLPLESKPDMLTTIDNDQLNISINIENSVKASEVRNMPEESDGFARVCKGSRRSSTAVKVTNRFANKLSSSSATSNHSSPTQRENKLSTIPLMSSTPREEEETPSTRVNLMSNTSILSVVDDTYPKTRSRYMNQSSMHLVPSPSNIMDKDIAIENTSKPLLNVDISDTSQAHLSNVARQDTTYNINKVTESKKDQGNKKDVTYELNDPQTPVLRQMVRKRTMTDANLSTKENVKKSCRVRFASVKPDENGAHSSVGKSTIGRQLSVPRNSGAQKNIRVMNLKHKSRKVEILKFNRNSLVSPLNAISSPKISRITPRGRLHSLDAVTPKLDKIQATPKRLESIEKKSGKVQSKIAFCYHIYVYLYSK